MRASSVGIQPEFDDAVVSDLEVGAAGASLAGDRIEVAVVCWKWAGSSVGELPAIF